MVLQDCGDAMRLPVPHVRGVSVVDGRHWLSRAVQATVTTTLSSLSLTIRK